MESVWDYPRPPLLENTSALLQVYVNDQLLAETRRGYRVLETSHPPVYYFPPEDIKMEMLVKSDHSTYCEWKGKGRYYHFQNGEQQISNLAWFYDKPFEKFNAIKNYLAFYAGKADQCLVDGEVVIAQPGQFYGGWITSNIKGPFKGVPGSLGW